MIETQVICDFCEKPLPKEGNDVVLHHTKEMDTRLMYPHLCEKCAGKIDDILIAHKNHVTTKSILSERMMRLNAERREKLGTSG